MNKPHATRSPLLPPLHPQTMPRLSPPTSPALNPPTKPPVLSPRSKNLVPSFEQMAAGIYADRKAAIENAKPSASQPKDFNALAASVYASRRGARA